MLAEDGRSLRTDKAVTDLPEPDSPTSATVWPAAMSSDTPRTASTLVSSIWNRTRRSSMESRAVT